MNQAPLMYVLNETSWNSNLILNAYYFFYSKQSWWSDVLYSFVVIFSKYKLGITFHSCNQSNCITVNAKYVVSYIFVQLSE